jgi:N-methylhydantoinase A
MEREGFPEGKWRGEFLLDLRYRGQSFSLRTPYAPHRILGKTITRFHALHKDCYGYADSKEPVEAVAVRLLAVATTPKPKLQIPLPARFGAPLGETQVYFAGRWEKTPIYLREHLSLDQTMEGPAILLQEDATTLLAPHWSARTDSFANLLFSQL